MADGFVILDKPGGSTSRQADWRVAKIFGEKKFGHIGTLDPMASGLLVVALGEATKMIPFIGAKGGPGAEKEYLFSIKWGIRTDTGDITGNVLEYGGRIPAMDEIAAAIPKLVGEYDQMPPAFSSKKINGVAAYVLARKGSEPKLSPKRVSIHELTIDNLQLTINVDDLIYRARCSAGTYVRALVQDIIKTVNSQLQIVNCKLSIDNCVGTASMIRRTQTNGFFIKDGAGLDFLENLYNNGGAVLGFLMPLDFGLDDIPAAKLETGDAVLFSRGGFIPMIGDGFRRVYSGDKFIGIGILEQGVLKPKRVMRGS
jgi:tRNA pseudouridine55 synthase